MMKYLFLVVLLVVGGAGGVMGAALVYQWVNNMSATQRVVPGERAFSMPVGSVPRAGGELHYPREEREAAAARKNPIPATAQSVERGGKLFAVYCTPCHGESGKGEGLVSTKFVPPPDITNAELQKARTDGYWQSYIGVGGAIMPSYGEALSPEERWHLVNYVRSLAQK
jgi:S-disulfanyl-L-cysteine oxidoreductase SoxD